MTAYPDEDGRAASGGEAISVLSRATELPEDFLAGLLPPPVFVHVPPAELDFANLDLDDPYVRWRLDHPDREGGPFAPRRVTWATAGDPLLVLLAVDDDEVLVGAPQLVWDGPHSLKVEVADVVSHQRDAGVESWLCEVVESVMAARLASFSTCVECGESRPPEWMMDDESFCYGCAERNHGVVF